MVSRIGSVGLLGIDGYSVRCECDIAGGLPSFDMVGLPDASVKESRNRVQSAARNCGFEYPIGKITVNLAPADTKKEGALYDVPIFLSLMVASEIIPAPPDDWAFVGELSLSGELRPVTGAFPMAVAAANAGYKAIFVPSANAAEASLAENIEVYGVDNLRALSGHLAQHPLIRRAVPPPPSPSREKFPDFADVRGQEGARRCAEIAAAGGHNLLLIGPPGSGKSMIANRIPSIMPDLTRAEALETTKIHSVCGELDRAHPLVSTRPFRSPSSKVSSSGLIGGGTVPHPGEISLAHNGVLFLDEFPEFPRDALESLRAPLEDGVVTISRVAGSITYPCKFMLVCAMNPCRCGWHGDSAHHCSCTPEMVQKYLGRISGPLLDRIDIQLEVPSVSYDDLSDKGKFESSEAIRERVNAARALQLERFAGTGVTCNGLMPPAAVREYCKLDAQGDIMLRSAFDRLGMTARSHDRILRVSRTIADLARSEQILAPHIAEALQYRCLDRRNI